MSLKKPKWKQKPRVEKKAVVSSVYEREDGKVIFSFQWFDGVSRWETGQNKNVHDFWEISEKLKSFEQKKWSYIAANSDRDHQIPFTDLKDFAQKAAIKKRLEQFDGIWSFHLSGIQRLWGVKAGDYFMVIWWDPEHLICPSIKN